MNSKINVFTDVLETFQNFLVIWCACQHGQIVGKMVVITGVYFTFGYQLDIFGIITKSVTDLLIQEVVSSDPLEFAQTVSIAFCGQVKDAIEQSLMFIVNLGVLK